MSFQGQSQLPLAYQIRQEGEGDTIHNANVFMAACVLATIPAVILFIFLQRYMINGISTGALKG